MGRRGSSLELAALAVPVASPLKLAALAVPVPNPLKLAALAVQERLASSPSYKNTHATKTTVASAIEVWFGNDVDKAA